MNTCVEIDKEIEQLRRLKKRLIKHGECKTEGIEGSKEGKEILGR